MSVKSIFFDMISINKIDLKTNLINWLKNDDFNGLNNLKFLDLRLNPIETIESNSFVSFKSNLKKIDFTIQNVSLDTLDIIKNSFKPLMLKSITNLQYYDSIYIENRNDIDCGNILIFLKSKIFYNEHNEHNDAVSFIKNCQDLTELRKSISRHGNYNKS